MPLTDETIKNWFMHHELDIDRVEDLAELRATALSFALRIRDLTPSSPDQTVAIRTLRECIFWCEASLRCGGA